jgi:hypothetical protein
LDTVRQVVWLLVVEGTARAVLVVGVKFERFTNYVYDYGTASGRRPG